MVRALVLALILAACAPAPPTATAPPTPTRAPSATTAPVPPAATQMPVKTISLRPGSGAPKQMRVEVADNPAAWERGLMFRTSMPEDAGMLFVFQTDVSYGFWMQNTLIPLSVAFIADDGRIVDILDMQPQTEDVHQPSGSYRYALEANQGFFERAGLKVGDRVELPA